MPILTIRNLSLAVGLAVLAGCGGQEESPATTPAANAPASPPAETATPAPATAANCSGEQGLTYICGVQGAEDLLSLGDTGIILGSGMSSQTTPAHMYLIDPD